MPEQDLVALLLTFCCGAWFLVIAALPIAALILIIIRIVQQLTIKSP